MFCRDFCPWFGHWDGPCPAAGDGEGHFCFPQHSGEAGRAAQLTSAPERPHSGQAGPRGIEGGPAGRGLSTLCKLQTASGLGLHPPGPTHFATCPLQTLSNVKLKALCPRRSIQPGGGPQRWASSLHPQHLGLERIALCVSAYTHTGISHTGINSTRLERQHFKPVCIITWHPIPAKTQTCLRINVRIYTFQCFLSITEASLPGVQSKMLNLVIPPYQADAPFIPFSQG